MELKFTIIQDTREKYGYDFEGSETVKLAAGDYGIKELTIVTGKQIGREHV